MDAPDLRFLELAGGLEPPTCCLQDSGEPSRACWPVHYLQLRSGGSSSQCAPVGGVVPGGMTNGMTGAAPVRRPGGPLSAWMTHLGPWRSVSPAHLERRFELSAAIPRRAA